MTSKARLSLILAVSVVALATACGGSTTPKENTPTPSAASATSSPSNGTSEPATAKVSANSASESEIETALGGAGVSNPARWAAEVVEYRPYPPDDPNLNKLRENLAKYNPGQETVDKIVSALSP